MLEFFKFILKIFRFNQIYNFYLDADDSSETLLDEDSNDFGPSIESMRDEIIG
jgi:hypothetical protein